MRARALGLGLGLLVGASHAAAQTPSERVVTVESAAQRLHRENLELSLARFQLSASRADVIAAGVLPNPGLTVGLNFLQHGEPTGGEQELSVVLDQVIPLAGQVGWRKEAASRFATAAEREFAAALWQLVSTMKKAYVDLQRSQAREQLYVAALRDLERVETVIAERSAAGANPAYDRMRASVERSNVATEVAAARADLVAKRTALAAAIGPQVEPGELRAVSVLGDPPDPPSGDAALIARALAQRAEIEAADWRVRASEARTESLRRQYIPAPDLAVGYTRWFQVPTATGRANSGMFFVGVGFPLPLFDRGQGVIDRGTVEAQAAQARKNLTEVTIRREIVQAAELARVRISAWREYRDKTATDIDKMRSIAELSYREGRASILELLDAYSAFVRVKERALDLRAEAVKASLDLERALGPSSK